MPLEIHEWGRHHVDVDRVCVVVELAGDRRKDSVGVQGVERRVATPGWQGAQQM